MEVGNKRQYNLNQYNKEMLFLMRSFLKGLKIKVSLECFYFSYLESMTHFNFFNKLFLSEELRKVQYVYINHSSVLRGRK